jgi:imidazole glycerol phosphate synthase glutamine amidotransferase subunit
MKDGGWIGSRANGASKPRVAVVDYGAGNLVSIDQALKAVGADPFLIREPDELERADALVVPGVGAAAPAMSRLAHRGLVEPIRQWIFHGRPFLGICLGLQLLFETSDEDGAETMGILAGRTARIDGAPTLPHIGWNQVERRRRHALFDGIDEDADFYFVHSYAGVPEGVSGEAAILAETTHGGRFVSAIDRGNVLGVQFHPERSGADGIRLLANFVRWASALAAGAGAQFAPTGAGGTGGGD